MKYYFRFLSEFIYLTPPRGLKTIFSIFSCSSVEKPVCPFWANEICNEINRGKCILAYVCFLKWPIWLNQSNQVNSVHITTFSFQIVFQQLTLILPPFYFPKFYFFQSMLRNQNKCDLLEGSIKKKSVHSTAVTHKVMGNSCSIVK